MSINCSGSTTTNTRVIVAGLTANPSAHRTIYQIGTTVSSPFDHFYAHLICVSASAGATGASNRTTWQLVEYSQKSTTSGLYRWSGSIGTEP